MAKKKKTKTSRKCRAPVDWSTLSEVQRFNRVFAIFKSVTAGGADGSIKGVNGSINAVSTKLILDSLRVKGGVVCDLGAADGKFMICAFLAGARRVLGVEFAENIGYKMVLEVFHCSHRVIELLFRLQVGFKEYNSDQDVLLSCPAHCLGNRSNQSS